MLSRNYFYTEKKESFFEEVECCKNIVQDKFSTTSIIGITFFVNALNNNDFDKKRKMIKSSFQKIINNLPINILSQPAGDCIAIEIWTHNSCDSLIYKRKYGVSYTIYSDSFGKSIWCLGLSANNSDLSMREQVTFSFEKMKTILFAEGFTMDHVVRQWNYIPQILKNTKENNLLYQNYQLFNEIRQSYYSKYKQNRSYPAATGIGMDFGTMTIDFVAIKSNDAKIVNINNPNQVNAYNYGQEVLVGSSLIETDKKTPLFERAKYLSSFDNAFIFISGTASIVGEKSLGLDDVIEQTNITIKNIFNLTSVENLKLNCSTESKLSYLRVYVKRREDMNTIIKVCKDHYGNIPTLFVKADICRDDLLVEIEGEAEFTFDSNKGKIS